MVLRGLRIFGLVALRRRWRSRCSGWGGGANGVYIACMALVFLLGFFLGFFTLRFFAGAFFCGVIGLNVRPAYWLLLCSLSLLLFQRVYKFGT
jgi:TRAP-type mannitol/chloroaromatic compound transport system permease large subunit